MNDDFEEEPIDFGFDIASVQDFISSSVDGFEPHMFQAIFEISPDNTLMNMGWGTRKNFRQEILELKRFKKKLSTLIEKSSGKLGTHEEHLFEPLTEALVTIHISLMKYDLFFGHENRRKPDWAARTVAWICYQICLTSAPMGPNRSNC